MYLCVFVAGGGERYVNEVGGGVGIRMSEGGVGGGVVLVPVEARKTSRIP